MGKTAGIYAGIGLTPGEIFTNSNLRLTYCTMLRGYKDIRSVGARSSLRGAYPATTHCTVEKDNDDLMNT